MFTAMNPENQQTTTQPPTQTPPSVQAEPTSSHGFPKKTILLIVILTLITVGLVALALMPKKPAPAEPSPVTQITPNPVQTILTISSTPIPQSTPSAYITDVVINTGQNKVTSAQLELSYDPAVLTKVDIESGSFFINPKVVLKNIDEKEGRITFALSSSDTQGALGQGILAKISFTILKKNVSTTIDFLPKTKVSAEGVSESVLKTSVGALFTLGTVPTLIVTPTATPSGR